jgi:hypothetical protein
MSSKQVRWIVVGGLVSMALAEVIVVLIGFADAPGLVRLASSAFAPPAIGIMGAFLTAVYVAGEDEDHASHRG